VDLDPVALVMVGKPARGKTFTAQRIARYTNWLGYRSEVFNVGSYRRARIGAGQPASFFDPRNVEGVAARGAMADAAVSDLVTWLKDGGEIGILDATNSTVERRSWVRRRCEAAGVHVVFVEVVCEDPAIIERNVRTTKVHSPDYVGRSADEAVADFLARIAEYEKVYEPVTERDASFVRIIDLGDRLELNRVNGFLPGRLVTFLMHLHDIPRPVYLTRHGESAFNLEERIGGDPPLTSRGHAYAERLAGYLREELGRDELDARPLTVWTSTLRRTIDTTDPLGWPVRSWKLLDEIEAGICDGMTYAEIADRMPGEFSARRADKFRYRYPRGESYQDVIARLDPVILELERQQRPVVIVAHNAVVRALYSYLTGTPPERCPTLDIPLHTVLKITPGPWGKRGSREERTVLGPETKGPTAPAP
jgi:broad specificity phosphatase PhoE